MARSKAGIHPHRYRMCTANRAKPKYHVSVFWKTCLRKSSNLLSRWFFSFFRWIASTQSASEGVSWKFFVDVKITLFGESFFQHLTSPSTPSQMILTALTLLMTVGHMIGSESSWSKRITKCCSIVLLSHSSFWSPQITYSSNRIRTSSKNAFPKVIFANNGYLRVTWTIIISHQYYFYYI